MSAALPPLLLVGYGRMAQAMVAGWRDRGLAHSYAVDPWPPSGPVAGLTVVTSAAELPAAFEPACIILAVKPQVAAAAVPEYARFAGAPVFLSVMAGRTLAGLTANLGSAAAIVRAMPNTPAAIGRGMTVACAGAHVRADQRVLCDVLLQAIGAVGWVEDEGQLDAITAISGGGPAYVFLLAELLERAGLEQGLSPDLARLLARQTVAGSGALLAGTTEPAGDMRRAVTSPGGTTERALAELMRAEAWPRAISRAIAAATERSRALAG